MWPLWPLAEADPVLWDLLVEDDTFSSFSVYGFFPAAYEIVYGATARELAVRYDGRTRGRVAIITGQQDAIPLGIVIKPSQSPSEPEIATIAGDLDVGPTQLPGIPGFISEEYVTGTFLTDLPPSDATEEVMWRAGEALAVALKRLHAAGVCYNDTTVSDPEGRSHMILEPQGRIRLIDFGVALLLDKHPSGLTFHDAYNAARTDPMFRLFRRMTPAGDQESLYRFVADYGRRLALQSPGEIQERDWRIAEEGTSVIARRFGPGPAAALRDGLASKR